MKTICDTSIEAVRRHYIDECRYTIGLREATIKSYSEAISFFIKIVPEIEAIEDINVFTVNIFFKRIHTRIRIVGKATKKSGVKDSTVLSYFTRLFTFFSWLETNGYFEIGALTSKLKKPKVVLQSTIACILICVFIVVANLIF